MEQYRIDMPDMSEAEMERDALIARFRNNRALAEYMNSRNVPLEEIELHPYRILTCLQKKHQCSGCTGLGKCTQKEKGYVEELLYNDFLETQLEPCSFMKEHQKEIAHLGNYLVSDMGTDLQKASFSRIDLARESREYSRTLAEVMKAYESGIGVYLYGNMGTGKSFLAACAANAYAKQGKAVVFVHCPKFVERLAKGYMTNEYHTEVQRLCYADFVVFDDIGAENVTERNRTILLSILDDRMQNHRVTWFTSNEDHESLLNHYISTSKGDDYTEAKRIMERIQALSQPVALLGKDRRTLYKM